MNSHQKHPAFSDAKEYQEAAAGSSITITLEDEVT